MNGLAYISLLACIFAFMLGHYVLFKHRKSGLVVSFFLYMLSVSILNLSHFQMLIAESSDQALLWSKVYSLWPISLALSIYFVLLFVRFTAKSMFVWFLIYVPAVVIAYLQFSTNLVAFPPVVGEFGWSFTFKPGPVLYFALFYSVAIAITSIWVLAKASLRTGGLVRKKLTVLLYAFVFNLVLEIAAGFVSPMLDAGAPGVSAIIDLLVILFLLYAVLSFRLFSTNSFSKEDYGIPLLEGYVIVLDDKLNILDVNSNLLSKLKYSLKDVYGKNLSFLSPDIAKKDNPLADFILKTPGYWRRDFTCVGSQGKKVKIFFSATPIRFKGINDPGYLFLGESPSSNLHLENVVEASANQLEYLSELALELLTMKNKADVYKCLSDNLYQLYEREALVAVIEVLETHAGIMWEVREIKGIKKNLDRIIKLIGIDPKNLQGETHSFFLDSLEAGKLKQLDFNLYNLTNGVISRKAGEMAKSLIGLKNLYVIPIQYGDQSFGSIHIATKKTTPVVEPVIIESIMAIAGMVLTRQYTEAKLKDQNEMNKRLLSVIGHDLKSPIASLVSYTDLLLEDAESLAHVNPKQLVSLVNKNAKGGLNILQGLLEWSQLVQKKNSFNPEQCKLMTIAQEAILHTQPEINNKGLKVQNKINDACIVNVDQQMILVVIRNLLSNAIKFTPQGGTIQLNSEIGCESIRFSIKDSGVGIPEDALKTLFNFDTRMIRTGTLGEKGSGLGLQICKDFILHHGGSIEAQSEPNKGTEFTVSLPVVPVQ